LPHGTKPAEEDDMTTTGATVRDPRTMIDAWTTALNQPDARAFAACFTPRCHARDYALEKSFDSPSVIETYCVRWFAAFPDYRIDVDDVLGADRSVVVRWTQWGTLAEHLPGLTDGADIGRSFSVPGVSVIEFGDDGLIRTESDYWNLATMLRQLRT
jgi:steroid delta-isomerase-like uncharacterized protein